MALAQKGTVRLPQVATGAFLLLFAYHLLSSYRGVSYLGQLKEHKRAEVSKHRATDTAASAAAVVPAAAAEAAEAAATPQTMSTASQMLRPIVKVVEGMRLSEGAGVQIRRTVSSAAATTAGELSPRADECAVSSSRLIMFCWKHVER
jgi:hypothetical protein